jgi:hypothetical protein
VSGALARVRSGSLTIRATLRNTAVGEDVFDRAWRVLSRPRSPLAQRQQRGTTTFESIASRINRGAVLAAFPPDVPTGTGTTVAVGALLAQTSPRGAFMSDYAKISDSVPLSPMTLLVASLLPPAGTALYELGWWKQLRSDASAGIPPKDTAATSKILDEMPSWSTFNPIEYTGKNAIAPTTNGKGSQQLAFRDAASALVTGLGMRPGSTKRLPAANLAELRDAVLAALDPDSTIPAEPSRESASRPTWRGSRKIQSSPDSCVRRTNSRCTNRCAISVRSGCCPGSATSRPTRSPSSRRTKRSSRRT